MNKANNTTAIERAFFAECEVVNLKYEYPGYTGTERFGIATELTENELREKYEMVLVQYSPYILLPYEFINIRKGFKQNNDKFEKRALNTDAFGYSDEELAIYHPETIEPDFTEALFSDKEQNPYAPLYEALKLVTETQRTRIIEHILKGKSLREIARAEGKDKTSVCESYNNAIKKIKKFLENQKNTPPICPPNSELVKGLVSDPDGNATQY